MKSGSLKPLGTLWAPTGLVTGLLYLYIHKIVFGWAVRVAVFQLSRGLMWTTSILSCMYLQSVTVCCEISAGLIRQIDLYATCYMGLLFDMRVSTSLIPFLQCPFTPYSLLAVYIQDVFKKRPIVRYKHFIAHFTTL